MEINWYPGHMAKTKRLIQENIQLIDVVLELVDARIPHSSKIDDLKDIIRNKPRILIMTKYDLCDKKETEKWIKFYEENEYKVLPINLKNNQDFKKILAAIETIANPINQKRNAKDLKNKEMRALVFGVPNVGKSTLINTLAGKKSQKVENRPGVTKDLVWIKTNHSLRILDTPGLLWPKLDSVVGINLAAMTSIKDELFPITEVCSHILDILYKHYFYILKDRYGIEDNTEFDLLFELIAKKIGATKRDEIDYERVSMHVINDVRNEHITGITFDRI